MPSTAPKAPNVRRIFLSTLIGSVGLSALIGIVIVLFGKFGNFETKVLATTLTVTITSILGLACGAYLEQRASRLIPLAGIVFAIAGGIMGVIVIWFGNGRSQAFGQTLLSTALLAASCSHLSLLSIAKLDSRLRWSRVSAHVAVWLLTVLVLYMIWNPKLFNNDLLGRMTGVLGIAIAALTILTPILHKLSGGDGDRTAIDDEIEHLTKRLDALKAQRDAADAKVSS